MDAEIHFQGDVEVDVEDLGGAAVLTVLLTGAAGFVGTSLAEQLSKRDKVVGIDLAVPKEQFCPVLTIDLTDRKEVLALAETLEPKPENIVHFAAQARVDPSLSDPVATYRANVEATINVIDLAVRLHSRLIYASSEIIYGEADRYPAKEFYTFRPDSPYAASKAAGDLMVQQMNGRGGWPPIKTVVLRSGMGYGPRSPPDQVITRFMLRCMDGKPLVFPDGPIRHPTRDANFIGNFVQGVMKVLEKSEVNGVFNMGSGREIDMLTLAEKVIEAVGEGRVEYRTDFKYRESEEGKRTWLDCTKAREAFDYNPKVSIDDGLRLTYDWLKNGGRALYGW